MRNIKMTIEYDGTHFSGWQEQPNRRTVQGEIQKSLQQIFQKKIKIIGAGRTDSGVHALNQVANFKHNTQLAPEKIQAALNGTLAKDVRIIFVKDEKESFHSRYDAKYREYHYKIATRETAINRYIVWHYNFPFDLLKMRTATKLLLGTHDFQSFCQSNAEVNHYFCSVEYADWEIHSGILLFKIIANRFLHNMVRIIVGTLLDIGRGKLTISNLSVILNAKDRRKAGNTVPAKGLTLVNIYY